MNKLYIFFMILLILPLVFGAEDVPIKTEITISYSNNTGILKITGENLEWTRLINTSDSFSEDTEIIMIRKFGNFTELSRMMDVCQEQLNFTQKWKDCIELNGELDVKIREMINGTAYQECLNNNTEIKHKYELEKISDT